MSAPAIDPHRSALFLDVDGTLLDIVDHPADVVADNQLVRSVLAAEERLAGAIALISGRTLAEIDRIFAPASLPAAGTHGTEIRLPDGHIEHAGTVPIDDDVVAMLQEVADRHPGLLLELKDGGVALHYRRAPQLEAEARSAIDHALDAAGTDFRLIDGKMVLEIAPRAHHKGAALERFMRDPVYADRLPVFFGDDVTDEDGFAAVNAMGGISIKVGSLQGSAARHCVPDVAAVRRWLDSFGVARQSA